MEALLRKSCPSCTESSIRTYTVNVRALAKEAGLEKPPAHAKWLTQKLLSKIKAKPVNQYKRLAIAGVKALGAYEKKDKTWHDAMNDATAKYSKERDSQKRTKREAENWPDGGYEALRKLAKTMHTEVQHLEKQKPSSVSASDMYAYQRYFIVLFYAYHALRGDLGDVRIERKGHNYLYKKGANWHMHIGQHKTRSPCRSRSIYFCPWSGATPSMGFCSVPSAGATSSSGRICSCCSGTRPRAGSGSGSGFR